MVPYSKDTILSKKGTHLNCAWQLQSTVTDRVLRMKGIVSRDEYFLEAYKNKKVLSLHALIVVTIFCFLVDEKKCQSKFILLL
jgi:hypothetical protein